MRKMKRTGRICICIAVLSLLFGCNQTTVEEQPIKGERITITIVDKGQADADVKIKEYDEQGHLRRLTNKNGNDKKVFRYIYEDGLLLKMEGDTGYLEVYEYNDQKLNTKTIHYMDDEISEINYYEYDEKGNQIYSFMDYVTTGLPDQENFFIYNEEGQLTEFKTVIVASGEESTTTYIYENGKLVKSENLFSTTLYEYDGDLKVIEIGMIQDEEHSKTVYEYREDGRLSKFIYENIDGFSTTVTYEYEIVK